MIFECEKDFRSQYFFLFSLSKVVNILVHCTKIWFTTKQFETLLFKYSLNVTPCRLFFLWFSGVFWVFLAIKTSINVLCFEVVILANNLKIIRTELCGKVGLLQSLSFSHFWIGPFWSGSFLFHWVILKIGENLANSV